MSTTPVAISLGLLLLLLVLRAKGMHSNAPQLQCDQSPVEVGRTLKHEVSHVETDRYANMTLDCNRLVAVKCRKEREDLKRLW